MSLIGRLLGHPFVFEKIRPLAVGGIDVSSAYRRLCRNAGAIVLDVGCGMGDALQHLDAFSSYLGVDTDPRAIDVARSRYSGRANVRWECRAAGVDLLRDVAPTDVAMFGLLHHLDDTEAVELLRMLGQLPSLRRAVTVDIVYLPHRPYNNLLARLDRGRFCRTMAGYVDLAERAGLNLLDRAQVPCHPRHGLVDYFVLELARAEPNLSSA